MFAFRKELYKLGDFLHNALSGKMQYGCVDPNDHVIVKLKCTFEDVYSKGKKSYMTEAFLDPL